MFLTARPSGILREYFRALGNAVVAGYRNSGFVYAEANVRADLIWRWRRAHSDYAAEHALAALNFQITVTISGLAVTFIAFFIPIVWILVIVVFTANLIYTGIAADHANSGLMCRYPLAFRWIHKPRGSSTPATGP